jgi:c-di-GMP-binding flagellar brake protein YcgR
MGPKGVRDSIILSAGMTLEVEDPHADNAAMHGELVSATDNTATLRIPHVDAHDLTEGMSVSGYLLGNGAVYEFAATVIDRHRCGDATDVVVAYPSQLHRIERRRYFRLFHEVPVRIRVKDAAASCGGRYLATSLDIAGGGVAVALDEQLEIGTQVFVRLRLDDGADSPVEASGTVVAARPALHSSKYRTSIAFEDISPAHRERLVHFVFDKQREHRQRRT